MGVQHKKCNKNICALINTLFILMFLFSIPDIQGVRKNGGQHPDWHLSMFHFTCVLPTQRKLILHNQLFYTCQQFSFLAMTCIKNKQMDLDWSSQKCTNIRDLSLDMVLNSANFALITRNHLITNCTTLNSFEWGLPYYLTNKQTNRLHSNI